MRRAAVEVLAPPASEPVTAEDLAAHLKLDADTAAAEDLAGYVTQARELFERETGRAILPTAFRQWLPRLAGPVELLRGPVLSVEAVHYLAPDGQDQELEGWELDAAGIPAVVYLPSGGYPAVSTSIRRPAWVDFTAGWPDPESVPALVRAAIRLLAGHYYLHREAYRDSAYELRAVPAGWRALCDLFDTGLTRGA
jgi:uncharacterized phiE125 gp8 family phage protein